MTKAKYFVEVKKENFELVKLLLVNITTDEMVLPNLGADNIGIIFSIDPSQNELWPLIKNEMEARELVVFKDVILVDPPRRTDPSYDEKKKHTGVYTWFENGKECK